MDTHRLDINSLYGGADIKSSKQPSKQSSKQSKNKVSTYSPNGVDPETQTSMSKLFKVNRELQQEIDNLKEQSKIDKLKITKLEIVINAHKIKF
tara:strand:- start:32 stop:313 length:282 start_codon:yes stop_codon:yes gene_type:complete